MRLLITILVPVNFVLFLIAALLFGLNYGLGHRMDSMLFAGFSIANYLICFHLISMKKILYDDCPEVYGNNNQSNGRSIR